MTFNPNEHLMQIKGKGGSSDYLPVQFRLVWFREAFPHGTIETELIHMDLDKETEEEVYVWSQEKRKSEKVLKTAKGVAIFRATVRDGQGGVATGTKMEKAASFADFLEKAETGSIGRALAALGYGTQFAPEFDEEHRIVDSPVEHPQSHQDEAERPVQQQPAPSTAVQKTVPIPLSDVPSQSKLKEDAKSLFPNRTWEHVVEFYLQRSYSSGEELSPDDCLTLSKKFTAAQSKKPVAQAS